MSNKIKTNINFNLLREGDLFFTADKSLLSRIIQMITKSKVGHVGQLIKPLYGSDLFYGCEMTLDVFGDEDLRISAPLDLKSIVSIKRVNKNFKVYDEEWKRKAFRQRMVNFHQKQTFGYDIRELISGIGGKKDRNKEDKICSRLIYESVITDGLTQLRSEQFDKYVTPGDLYNSSLFIEVEGWKNEQV